MGGPPLESGWLRVEHGVITALGRRSPPGTAAERVDLGDAILAPGLVNAHTHLEFSSLDAPFEAAEGLAGWIGSVVAARRRRDAGDPTNATGAAAIRRGLRESAAAGVTTIGEIATASPLHAYAGPGPAVRVFREGLGLGDGAVQGVPSAVAADLDRLARTGFAGGVSPHAPYSVTAPLGLRLVNEAMRRSLPVAMHVCESREEEELLASGGGPFRHLLEDLGAWDASRPPRLLSPQDWIGLLARTRRGVVVHATHIDRNPAALARLARHRDRLAVVICPRTTRRISGVSPPVALLHTAGLRVAIGTDSRASNPDLSMLGEGRAVVGAGLIAPEKVLRMSTVEGAWALGLEDRAGLLAVGRPADLVVLRPAAAATDPFTAAFEPDTRVTATLRRGRPIAGRLE